MNNPNVEITQTYLGDWMIFRRLPNGFPLPLIIARQKWQLQLYAWWNEKILGATIE